MFDVMISLFISLIKYLLFTTYHSTDFEVHRNWKAITNTLPIRLWYYDETSEWTMDYPPMFAYMEYCLGFISKYIDPKMTELSNLNYKSIKCVYFQRTTVLLCDIILFYSLTHLKNTLKLSYKKFLFLICLLQGCVGLILLDNIHFQYNTILFSLFIVSISLILRENYILGAVVYCILINMKHIFICCAPAYLAFYLKFYVFDQNKFPQIKKLFLLAFSMISVFLVVYSPFILIAINDRSFDIFTQILKRLFPFKRGLLHTYWAPNIWALYSFLDKILSKVLKKSGVSKNLSSLGLTQDVSFDVLPDISSKMVIIILIGLSLLLILFALIKAKNSKQDFLKYLNLSCFIFFNFGFQVHEKALMNNTIILTINYFLYLGNKDTQSIKFNILEHNFILLTVVSTLAQFPLINSTREFPIKLLLILSLMFLLSIISKHIGRRFTDFILFIGCVLVLLDLIYLVITFVDYNSLIHFKKILSKFQFFPILMISVISSIMVQISIILSLF